MTTGTETLLPLIILITAIFMKLDEFDISSAEWLEIGNEKKKKSEKEEVRQGRSRGNKIEMTLKYKYRRAFSESNLIELMSINPLEENTSYNFITTGNIDALSFLKIILLHQNLEYLLFSTWCMSIEDILQIEEWINNGKIKKMDAYLGEIFPSSYINEYQKLKSLFSDKNIGRLAIFRNHSKVFAGYGDKFYFGIQSSANINTNTRTENAVITINKEIYQFYRDYFDGIVSFV